MGDQGEKRDKKLTPKGRLNYANLLEYLSNPENDWPKRTDYSCQILDYVKPHQIYATLTPQILTEIESEAMEIRKARTARQRSHVYNALYRRAIGCKHDAVHISNYQGVITDTDIEKEYPPDAVAAREFLDRTEGKVMP